MQRRVEREAEAGAVGEGAFGVTPGARPARGRGVFPMNVGAPVPKFDARVVPDGIEKVALRSYSESARLREKLKPNLKRNKQKFERNDKKIERSDKKIRMKRRTALWHRCAREGRRGECPADARQHAWIPAPTDQLDHRRLAPGHAPVLADAGSSCRRTRSCWNN